MKSTISRLATSEISILYLVSVAEETGLNLALLETRRQVFSRHSPIKAPKQKQKGWPSVENRVILDLSAFTGWSSGIYIKTLIVLQFVLSSPSD